LTGSAGAGKTFVLN